MKNIDLNKQTILIFHSMFCNSKVYLTLLKDLEKDYNVIGYDFSNHNNLNDYKNSKKEAKLIIKNLISDNIFKLKAIIGFSLGSRIALDFIKQNKKVRNIIDVEKYILEGAPIYKNAKIRRIIFSFFVFGTILLKNSKYVYYKVKKRVIKPINEILDVIQRYKKDSVKKIVKDCTSFSFFDIKKTEQKKINFLYPYYDLNILCYFKLKKQYKHSNFHFYKGLHTHCSKVFLQSSKYIKEQLLPILERD